MSHLYINKKISNGQLIIDIPESMKDKEVDIFIIPKHESSNVKNYKAKDFIGKLSHLNINDFIENIDLQRQEWQRNSY